MLRKLENVIGFRFLHVNIKINEILFEKFGYW